MFLKSSRYYNTPQIKVTSSNNREVSLLKLRRLPVIQGSTINIKQNDRLDILSQRNYNDATLGWHIADANSELQANNLIESIPNSIELPEN